MKYILILSLTLLWLNPILSQNNYKVGLKKVVFINDTVDYEFQDYKAGLPFFCYIWYPTNDTSSSTYLMEDYYKRDITDLALKNVHDTLIENYAGALKFYGIRDRIGSFRSVKYGSKEKKCFEAALKMEVPVIENATPINEKFSLVIYHHGAGGTGEPNRRAIRRAFQLPVPGPELQFSGGARGSFETEGNQLHPCRRIPGG